MKGGQNVLVFNERKSSNLSLEFKVVSSYIYIMCLINISQIINVKNMFCSNSVIIINELYYKKWVTVVWSYMYIFPNKCLENSNWLKIISE